jgi:hypothetical protein
MATGAGLSGIVAALLPLIGLITVWSARRRRKLGIQSPEDGEFERRQAAQMEMERRMASYLAERGLVGRSAAYDASDEQEIRR